jgi:hypothetical protein
LLGRTHSFAARTTVARRLSSLKVTDTLVAGSTGRKDATFAWQKYDLLVLDTADRALGVSAS